MQSKATTVASYLAQLTEDRKAPMTTLVNLIRKNVDRDIEEGILYGMIGFFIPHRVYPAGYHCDPKLPVGYIALASQKNHMSLYLNWIYYGAKEGGVPGPNGEDNEHVKWFNAAWAKTGKKLDMGKCCIRFKRIEDLPLDVIAEAIRRVPTKVAIQHYEHIRDQSASNKPAKSTSAKSKPDKSKPDKIKPAAKAKPSASAKAAPKSAKKAAKKTVRKAAGR